MCFSATGSFTVSAILTLVGAVTLGRSDRRATHMLAAIPLLFAVQQSAEGIVWLTFETGRGGLLHTASVNLFLGFALVVWPTWFPVALGRFETEPARRRWFRPLVGFGLVVSAIGAALLLHWQPHAMPVTHGVCYDFGLQDEGLGMHAAYLLFYTVPIVVPFLNSTLPLARTIGLAILVALFTTLIIKQGAFASAWCFFAAIISALIAVALRRARRTSPAPLAMPR